MHILPTRGRPQFLQRFFDEGQPEQPGVVVLDRDNCAAYQHVRYPKHWDVLIVEGRNGYVASANAGFKHFPNALSYQMSSDDCVGRTPGWDTVLARAAAPRNIVWPNDMFQGKCTFPCVGGDLCRALGWFVHPAFWHMYSDTVWGDIQRELGTGGLMKDVALEHMHYVVGKAKMDDTYRGRVPPKKAVRKLGESPFEVDKSAYAKLDLQALVAKIRCAL